MTLSADTMSLSGNIAAGSAIATLQPENVGVTIEMGGNTSAGTLDLTTPELQTVSSASVLHVGNSSRRQHHRHRQRLSGLHPTTLSLISNGTIASNANGSLADTNLRLQSGTGVSGSSVGGLTTHVSNIVFDNTLSGNVTIYNQAPTVSGLTVKSIDGQLTANNTHGAVKLTELSPIEFNTSTSAAEHPGHCDR